VVREYAAVKREKDLSIVQFIDSQASSRYQVPTTPETIEYLLLSGNLSVIFDGLDEVLDPQSRREVACDIESFCNLFRQVPVLITSRTVGYDQAPLDARRFDVLAIEDFDTGRVTEYARKWFTVYGDLATSEVGDVVDNFMTESIVARDIRSNPLMLALICNLYRGEHYIPRNLAELYEKCSLMLFDRWDRFRGTRPSLPFEHHVFPTMNYLAQWMYWGGGGGTAVSEGRLVDAAVEYLYPTRFLDRDEARSAATQFIAFCKGRAWVFSEVGCKESGEGIYQFTHRTFLEYFAACYLVRTYVTSKDLAKRLLVDIKDGNLQVVAQLAIQMHGRNFDSGADQLMMEFMRDSRSADGKRKWDSLLFLARLLGVLIPSAKVTRGITERILQTSIEEGTDTVPGPSYLIEALLHSAEENLSTIRKVADVTLKRLESRDPKYVPRVDIVREWISKGTTGDAIGR
jgi:predicted NACHT family NTPase